MPKHISDTPLTDEQRLLVERKHSLIYAYIRNRRLDIDEWYDIIATALCKAAIANDTIKYPDEVFASFFWKCARNAERSEYNRRKNKLDYRCLYYEDIAYKTTDGDLYLKETIPDPNPLEYYISLNANNYKLSKKEKEVLNLMWHGNSQTEVAKKLNHKLYYISRITGSIRKKIKANAMNF